MKDHPISLSQAIANCCTTWSGGSVQHPDRLVVTGIFIFPADFPAFEGHFTGRPVLPAIIQLAALTHLAGLALGAEIRPQHYKKTKFRAMIQPGDEIHIEIKIDHNGSARTGAFSLRHKTGELVSSGSVHY